MATVKAFIRTTRGEKGARVHVRFRLRDGAKVQLFHKSDITVQAVHWDAERECIKAKVVMDAGERLAVNVGVGERKRLMAEIYHRGEGREGEDLRIWFAQALERELNPTTARGARSFGEWFEAFLQTKEGAMRKDYATLGRIFLRYEQYRRLSGTRNFTLHIDTFEVAPFETFFKEEGSIAGAYPELYVDKEMRHTTATRIRARLYVYKRMKQVRAFFRWLNEQGATAHQPFRHHGVPMPSPSRPIYINVEERNIIYGTDLSGDPFLERQRDIFVFQCLVGCRVSDLCRLTPANIVGGALEYIPVKTQKRNPSPIRVPLTPTAREIVGRYKEQAETSWRLLPFVDEKRYNEAIREVFVRCGITRIVTRLNPSTGKEEQRPINELASSHMARKCFVGALYKKVRDPSLIGALSGHAEGSTAFARYREIDEEIKIETVNLIE